MLKEKLIKWTRDYLGADTKVVLGISGGKDSTIMYALLKEAIGVNRIIPVTIPDNFKDPLVDKIADYYHFDSAFSNFRTVSIHDTYEALSKSIFEAVFPKDTETEVSSVYTTNTPARLRMTVLYGIAALVGNARVVCTSNLSEDYVSWFTKFGDGAGDFAPFANLTVREVKQLGYELGVPTEFIEKVPDDGMCGKSDEDKLGFTYEELDSYLLGENSSPEHLDRIEQLHRSGLHKLLPMPKFEK